MTNIIRKLIMSPNAMIVPVLLAILSYNLLAVEAKDFNKKEYHPVPQKGSPCIARFESSTGEPLYYNCPRPNESEKKSYCCSLDKCCDYKEFQKQTEQQFKATQAANFGYMSKTAIGGVLKVLMWIVFFVILLIVGCCCLVFLMCRKKKLFQGGVFNSPLPAQPPGPSPYAPPTSPYMAYQWPPETGPASNTTAPPAYPAYPAYPQQANAGGYGGGPVQPPYNPNYK